MSILSCKGGERVYNKETEKRVESTISEEPITTERYFEILYSPETIGQSNNIVVFELAGTGIPIVLYTYTDDYLAYLEINGIFIPFFDGYHIEFTLNEDNKFKLLDEVKIFKKNSEYLLMFPAVSTEFLYFQLIGFDRNGSYKDYGYHTYDDETFSKVIATPYEEKIFYVKAYQNTPRVYVQSEKEDFLLKDVSYRPQESYERLSKEQINYLKQLKDK